MVVNDDRVDAASGYGVVVTLAGGVLLALSYYGVGAIAAGRQLGTVFPVPVYVLAVALLFVVELLNSRLLGLYALGRAIAFAVGYGTLFVFAVEGAAVLWADPEIALDGYIGLSVLAGALVTAALLYVGYLSVVDST
ncbi:MAG: hypothetical protein R6V31_01245 [Halohasta sp.]